MGCCTPALEGSLAEVIISTIRLPCTQAVPCPEREKHLSTNACWKWEGSIDRLMDRWWYIHSAEFCSATKRTEGPIYAKVWIYLNIVLWNAKSQTRNWYIFCLCEMIENANSSAMTAQVRVAWGWGRRIRRWRRGLQPGDTFGVNDVFFDLIMGMVPLWVYSSQNLQ